MTKATTKGEKKRRRRARKAEDGAMTRDPFALAAVPRREPNGREARREKENADRLALTKRASMAEKPITAETIRDMRAPWWGCNAGRAIAASTKDEKQRERLWSAVCHIRRTITAYDRAIGAPSRHAKCLRLLAPLDAMHADASTPAHDDRTEDERYRQAIAAWAALKGWLTFTDYAGASECIRVVVDDGEVRDAQGMLYALTCVAEGVGGERMTLRHR